MRGDICFGVEWQFTREGLLLKEVELLERLLAEKVGEGGGAGLRVYGCLEGGGAKGGTGASAGGEGRNCSVCLSVAVCSARRTRLPLC